LNATATILVTGATGALGRQTVEQLLERVPAHTVAALARNPQAIADLAGRGVDVRQGDYDDPKSLQRAFSGIDKLLLISTTVNPDGLQQHQNVIDAAVKTGVGHIYFTGVQRAANTAFDLAGVTGWIAATERALAESGLDVTLLQNALYLDALPLMFGADVVSRGLRVPAGDRAAAVVARRDLAEGNAAVLAGDGHAGKTYTFGSSEAVTMAEIATAISDATGQLVAYQDVPAEQYVTATVAAGLPEPVAQFLVGWFQAIAAGEFAEVSKDLENLIGHRPTTAADFFAEIYKPA
jgi:NAD(P)H dehydrogenase (quinone)